MISASVSCVGCLLVVTVAIAKLDAVAGTSGQPRSIALENCRNAQPFSLAMDLIM